MENNNKEQINIVVIGHVDAGKSTTTGHLMYLLGGIESRTLEKFKKMSEEQGKGSFCFAWIFDNLEEERKRGITINCSLSSFETKKFKVTIIDAPGHKDFIKNMLTGTSQADAAILVISAKAGEFESGISKEGSTKEHALLSFAFGIKQLIVLVNKMDDPTVSFKKDRFEEIVSNGTSFLTKIGFKKENIQFVPVSGWKGDNLVKPCEQLKWYSGPTAEGAIDLLSVPKRPVEKPLRIPIQDVFKISGMGTVVSGRVESGVVKAGMQICIMPAGIVAEVKSVEQHRQPLKEGVPGQTVGINLRGVSAKEVKRGFVVGPVGKDAPSVVTKFTAQMMVLNHPKEIRVGYTPVVDCHSNHVSCKIVEIVDKKEKKGTLTLNPVSIKNGDTATCVFVPQKPICMETFKSFGQLGRFAVRDMQKTVAVGIVTSIETSNNPSN